MLLREMSVLRHHKHYYIEMEFCRRMVYIEKSISNVTGNGTHLRLLRHVAVDCFRSDEYPINKHEYFRLSK